MDAVALQVLNQLTISNMMCIVIKNCFIYICKELMSSNYMVQINDSHHIGSIELYSMDHLIKLIKLFPIDLITVETADNDTIEYYKND